MPSTPPELVRPYRRLQLTLTVVACVLVVPGVLSLVAAAAPAPSCQAGQPCAPGPSSFLVRGLVLLGAAVLAGLAAVGVARLRGRLRFDPPPGWPPPPDGWTPAPDWRPDPGWPLAPPGWRFWRRRPRS